MYWLNRNRTTAGYKLAAERHYVQHSLIIPIEDARTKLPTYYLFLCILEENIPGNLLAPGGVLVVTAMNDDQFWRLLEPEHPRAEAFCRKLAGNRDDGDDLYQEALLAALGRVGSLRKETSFRPWLYRIIVNRYRNLNRSPWWRRRTELTDDLVESGTGHDPSESLTARRWLRRGFEALSADERALVTLFELEGWTIPELSRLYGRPEGTLKARLSRARRKMRDRITAYLQRVETVTTAKEGPLCVVTKRNVG